MQLSKEIKIQIVILFSKSQSYVQVQRDLKAKGYKEKPTRLTIKKVFNRFIETGSVADRPKSGRPEKFTKKQKSKIKDIYEMKPKSTLREISQQTDMSRSTVWSFMHNSLSLKSYKIQIHQHLHEEDFDRRVQTAEVVLPYLNDTSFEKLIFFSDESTFHISGYVHKENCRIWGTEKPSEFYEHHYNTPKTNVWCAMSSDCIIGPYFFDENVTGQNYLNMLKTFFWPRIQKKRLCSKILFQQDGAAAHYSLPVREWLNKKLPGRWFGRRGAIKWAAARKCSKATD